MDEQCVFYIYGFHSAASNVPDIEQAGKKPGSPAMRHSVYIQGRHKEGGVKGKRKTEEERAGNEGGKEKKL